jgi:crotonobetaine/carnitine-CoA ligase
MDADHRRHHPLPPLEERTVAHALEVAAERGSPGVRDGDTLTSPRDIAADADIVAAGIAALGVGRGDAVLTMLDNHVEHVRVWFALARAGIVSVPVNTASRHDFLRHVLRSSRARVLLCEQRHLAQVESVIADVPEIATVVVHAPSSSLQRVLGRAAVVDWEELRAYGSQPPVAVQPWDIHSVMYTSGSTGGPKGVVVTHAHTYTRALVVDQRVKDADGVALVSVPLFHVAGQCRGVLGPLMQGLETVVLPRFSVSGFWAEVRRHRATSALLMGAMASYLLGREPSPDDRDHTLRLALMAPVTERAREFEERFGVRAVASYGSTEAGNISSGATNTAGSLGWAHPAFEVRVADEQDRALPTGSTGELLVRSRDPWTMTLGYQDQPEATAALWRNQWLHTGDRVRMTETAELVFAGRSKDIIRRSGENISPSDVEEAVRGVVGVADCVALGVPSPDGEEDVKIAVVPAAGAALDPLALHDELVPLLPRFMVPRYIEIVDAVPLTATNKVDRPALRRTSGVGVWSRD